jgi:hypothetical protein
MEVKGLKTQSIVGIKTPLKDWGWSIGTIPQHQMML